MKLFGVRDNLQGTTPGHQSRGRPRIHWEDNITKCTGPKGDHLLRLAEYRRLWRRIVHKPANLRNEDG